MELSTIHDTASVLYKDFDKVDKDDSGYLNLVELQIYAEDKKVDKEKVEVWSKHYNEIMSLERGENWGISMSDLRTLKKISLESDDGVRSLARDSGIRTIPVGLKLAVGGVSLWAPLFPAMGPVLPWVIAGSAVALSVGTLYSFFRGKTFNYYDQKREAVKGWTAKETTGW